MRGGWTWLRDPADALLQVSQVRYLGARGGGMGGGSVKHVCICFGMLPGFGRSLETE